MGITLNEAYEITNEMSMQDHRKMTKKQSEAKWLIYKMVIRPQYKSEEDMPPHLEPDFMEGWS